MCALDHVIDVRPSSVPLQSVSSPLTRAPHAVLNVDWIADGSRAQQVLSRIRDAAKRLETEEYEKRASQVERQASRSLRSSLRRSFFKGDSTGSLDSASKVVEQKPVDAKIGRMEPK
jgi:hypothetical protein